MNYSVVLYTQTHTCWI